MGLLSQISTALGVSRKQVSILMIGLDNSGKSTLVNQMKTPDLQTTQIAPTIGYTNDKFIYGNTTFSVYDMSGQGKYRNLWESHYRDVDGVVFVVDSSDRLRIAVARDELWLLMDHKEFAPRKLILNLIMESKFTGRSFGAVLQIKKTIMHQRFEGDNFESFSETTFCKAPLLVLTNKIDEKGSMTASEISQCLGLDLIRTRNWNIFATCALTGQGLGDAFEWLAQNIRDYLESKK